MNEKQKWIKLMEKYRIPKHLQNGLAEYLTNGIRPGNFLTSCLENNLYKAIFCADMKSLEKIRNIMMFLWIEIPATAWGNPTTIKKWMNERRKKHGTC